MILHKTRIHRVQFFRFLAIAVFTMQTAALLGQEQANQHQKQIVEIELADGAKLKGRLCMPGSEQDQPVETLIVFVHGTGPGTYLNKRKLASKEFDYFDFFSQRFNDRGIAFFSYNKRGVTIGKKPPYFDEVDREKFRKAVPSVEVQDLATIVDVLKKNDRLANSKVALLGWSEGTMIASLVAEQHPDKIDALLLAGYAHENLFDIIKEQFSGNSSMRNLNPVFDKDDDHKISQEEYESEDEPAAKFRKRLMQGTEFELLDATKDGQLTAEDFAIRTQSIYAAVLSNLADNNEDWIWKNYFRVSIPWLREHFSLEANKTRLPRLKIPIYVFHGEADANVDVQGVYDLEKRFAALGKSNLDTFVFEDHDHDLNFMQWVTKDELPAGIAKIFEIASSLSNSD